MMITTFNKERADKIRKKWLNNAFNFSEINREKSDAFIDWLYEFSKLDKPIKIYVSSPLGAQYAVAFLKVLLNNNRAQVWDQVGAQVRDQVGDQVGAQVRDQVGDQVRAQVRAQVGAQVGDQVGDQVWDQVGAQVRDQVGDQVRAQVRDQVGDQGFISFASYGNWSDYGFASWGEYFKEEGCKITDNFTTFASGLFEGNFYDMIQLKGFCIVCEKPFKIYRDEQNRLHNTSAAAIEWRDGFKLYYIHGRALPAWIWEEKETITKEKFLGERNSEIRAGMYEVLGQKRVFDMLGAEIVDECTDNGETLRLWKTRESFEEVGKLAWVECQCPSTRTNYLLGVESKHKSAKSAMASLWGLTKGQYNIISHT